MENLHLLRPYMLLLLIPAVMAIVFLFYRKKAQNNWDKICDSHLLKHLSIDTGKASVRLSLIALLAMWTIAVVAISGPAWRQAPQPAYRNQSATVVVLDLSYSMLAQDIKPSRIERAKYKVIDLLEKRKDGQLSLVVFAGDAHAVTPLTDDINTIKAQIEPLDPMIMPFPGSRPDQGVTRALELLKNGVAKNGEIILLTDGAEGHWQQLEDMAADVNAVGHTLSIIGVGTKAGAPIPAEEGGFIQDKSGAIVLPKLDDAKLKQAAREGGGQYITMTADDRDINTISRFNLNKKQIDKEKKQQVSASWSDDGYWLVFLVLPIALYCFRKGVVFSFILALMILPSFSHSAEPGFWSKLWKNQQQLGVEQLKDGEYETAEQNLQGDTLWKGAAQYRAGKFEDAIKTLEGDESALADYNRGNALAHMERYEEAIAAYEQALEKDPENQDAKDNKELIEKYLQQQEQQSQDQQNQDGQKGENQEGQKQDGQKDGSQEGAEQKGEQQDGEQEEAEQSQQQSGQQDDSQQQEPEQQQDLTQQKQGQNQEEEQEQEKQAQQAKQQSEEQPEQDNVQEMLQEDSEQPSVETKPLDQKTEQWLRQIPDNPGGLLKRKFYYESKKKYDKGTLPDTKNRW